MERPPRGGAAARDLLRRVGYRLNLPSTPTPSQEWDFDSVSTPEGRPGMLTLLY
jgi:hypothetical protein